MSDIPVFDLLGAELGAADEKTAAAARVIADALGPGSTVQAARIANALRDAGVLDGSKPELPAPDTVEDYGDGYADVPYWFTPTGAVSAVGPEGAIRMDADGAEVEMDIATAEDNAHALLAAVQHLRSGIDREVVK